MRLVTLKLDSSEQLRVLSKQDTEFELPLPSATTAITCLVIVRRGVKNTEKTRKSRFRVLRDICELEGRGEAKV